MTRNLGFIVALSAAAVIVAGAPADAQFTSPLSGKVMDLFILNRDRTELTVWRTLNVVMPDGSSGKNDCGNRVAVVYVRQR